MAVNKLCAAFRQIVGRRSHFAVRSYSTQISKQQCSILPLCSQFSDNASRTVNSEGFIKFIPRTLNVDFGIPFNDSIRRNIIEIPFKNIPSLEDPLKQRPPQQDIPFSDKALELPTFENIIEKQAVRLIVIRRRKMKKHKRKKLRKRMQYVWAKIRTKRNLLKEKVFQAELIAKVKEAQAFDAKKYVAEKLEYASKTIEPRIFRGEILDPELIKKFQAELREKRRAKRNKPRLTL